MSDPTRRHCLRTLLAEARIGNERSLEALLTALVVPIRRYLASHLTEQPDALDLADDLTQETLIRIITRLQLNRPGIVGGSKP